MTSSGANTGSARSAATLATEEKK
ncbi:hypothetical protein YPPY25_2821, partial [Yersinia pestis PY-25]